MTEASVTNPEEIQLEANENDEENMSSVEDASLAEDDFQLVSKKRNLSRKSSAVSSKSAISLSLSQKDDKEKEENAEPSDVPCALIGPDTEEIRDIMYGQESQQKAVWNLIFFSIMMFTVPFVVMYLAYLYFLDYENLPPNTAVLYAGIIGAVIVYLIVAIFVWVAYREEKVIAAQVEETAKKKDE